MSTYDDASLIYYPSGVKLGKAYSLKPTDGSGDLTFTRASTATRVNESGLIESVATGVPRIDFTGGGCGKLLLEPQRTNVQRYSNTLSTNWIITGGATVSYNNAISPDGTNNATYFSAAYGSKGLYNSLTITTSTYTASVWAKSKGLGNDKFQLGEGSGTGTGGVGEFTATSEWQRFTKTGTTVSGGRPVGVFQPIDFSAMDILFWGYQYEEGSYPTSYIPTLGTAVTRLADSASKTGISSLIGQTEGTLYAEFLHNGNTARIIAIGDNSTNNRLFLSNNGNKLQIFLLISGSLILSGTGASSFINGINKVAVRYNSGNIATYLNGVQQITSSATFTTTALSNLFILSSEFAPNQQSGLASMQSAMVFLNGKSNAELATLTTI